MEAGSFAIYYSEDNFRLWNELTIKLNTFVKNPALQNEDALLTLYHNFICVFETK